MRVAARRRELVVWESRNSPSQASMAMTVTGNCAMHAASKLTLVSSGHTGVGGLVSTTVTEEVHEAVLPAESLAVYKSSLEPIGESRGGGAITTGVEQLSVADPGGGTNGAERCETHSITAGAGQLIVGGVQSSTVTTTGPHIASA